MTVPSGSVRRRRWVPSVLEIGVLIALGLPALFTAAVFLHGLVTGMAGSRLLLTGGLAAALVAILVVSVRTRTARGPAAFLGLVLVAVCLPDLRFWYGVLAVVLAVSVLVGSRRRR